jgi:hypothetical protein
MGGGMVPPCILVGGGMVPPLGDERQAMVPAEGVKGHANRCRTRGRALHPAKRYLNDYGNCCPTDPR